MSWTLRTTIGCVIVLLTATAESGSFAAEGVTVISAKEIELVRQKQTNIDGVEGQRFVLRAHGPVVRLVTDFDPDVVELQTADGDSDAVEMKMLHAGSTTVRVVNEDGEVLTATVNVESSGATAFTTQLRDLYPGTDVRGIEINGALLLRGTVENAMVQRQMIEIAEQFFPTILDQIELKESVTKDDTEPKEEAALNEKDQLHRKIQEIRSEVKALHAEVRKLMNLIDKDSTATTGGDESPIATVDMAPGTQVLFFTASFCQPCQQMVPVIRRLQGQYSVVKSIDTAKSPDIARSHRVMRIPTLVFLRHGVEYKRLEGIRSGSEILQTLARADRNQSL